MAQAMLIFADLISFLYIVVRNAVNDEVVERFQSSTGPIEITVNIGIIVFVEVSLKWNNITGVHSLRDPGQFMPFFISLAQLISTIYQLLISGKAIDDDSDVWEDDGKYYSFSCGGSNANIC